MALLTGARRPGRLISALLACLVLSLAAYVRLAAQQTLEYEVKAAYLYNIIDFVTWPSEVFTSAADPIRICVVGPDPFGPVLDRTMDTPVAGKRSLIIERINADEAVDTCNLLFVPQGNRSRAELIIRAAASRPILTVGETPDFLHNGGMIAFVIDGGRVRFDVNPSVAAARGLSLSSRLLRVARSVVGKGGKL